MIYVCLGDSRVFDSAFDNAYVRERYCYYFGDFLELTEFCVGIASDKAREMCGNLHCFNYLNPLSDSDWNFLSDLLHIFSDKIVICNPVN
jgi:hypothetical protein